MAGIKELLKF